MPGAASVAGSEGVPETYGFDLVAGEEGTFRVFLGDIVSLSVPEATAGGYQVTWSKNDVLLPAVTPRDPATADQGESEAGRTAAGPMAAPPPLSSSSAPAASTLVLGKATNDVFGKYTATWGTGSIAECNLSRNRSPSKFCPSCGRRNHAHSRNCSHCDSVLPSKRRAPKRRAVSLTMKNYEDSIFDKVRCWARRCWTLCRCSVCGQ